MQLYRGDILIEDTISYFYTVLKTIQKIYNVWIITLLNLKFYFGILLLQTYVLKLMPKSFGISCVKQKAYYQEGDI